MTLGEFEAIARHFAAQARRCSVRSLTSSPQLRAVLLAELYPALARLASAITPPVTDDEWEALSTRLPYRSEVDEEVPQRRSLRRAQRSTGAIAMVQVTAITVAAPARS